MRDELRGDEEHGQHQVRDGIVPAERRGAVDEGEEPRESVAVVPGLDGRGTAEGRDPVEAVGELALHRGVGQGAVEADEDGEGGEGGEASRERVEVRLLVQPRGLHLQALGVVGVHRLELLDARLDGLHLEAALNLLLGEGEGDHLDEDGEREDGVAVGVRNAEALKTAVDPLDA